MRASHIQSRRSCTCQWLGTLILLGGSVISARVHGQTPATPTPPPAAATHPADTAKPVTPAKAQARPTVKENIKGLSKEATDPGTLKRIKGHEQALEKKIERIRDQQRADHTTKPLHDTVDVVKRLDDPEPGAVQPGALRPAGTTEPGKAAPPPAAAPAPRAAPPAGSAPAK